MIRWLRSFPYFFREALKNFLENPGVAFIAIGTTAVSLVFLGVLWAVHLNVSKLIDLWRERFQLTIFLSDSANAQDREAIRKFLLGSQAVERIEEIPPEKALKEFRSWLGEEADLLKGFDEDFLPASMRVILKPHHRDLSHVEALMAQVRVMKGVEQTRNDLTWLRRLESAIRLLRVATWAMAVLLGLGVVFIIANTIRLTLFARREDIAIMHLVGATDPFIKMPYVTEGVLCGVTGGLAAFAVLWVLFYGFFVPFTVRYLGGTISLSFASGPLFGVLVGSGALMGYLGSLLSVRHFLRSVHR